MGGDVGVIPLPGSLQKSSGTFSCCNSSKVFQTFPLAQQCPLGHIPALGQGCHKAQLTVCLRRALGEVTEELRRALRRAQEGSEEDT